MTDGHIRELTHRHDRYPSRLRGRNDRQMIAALIRADTPLPFGMTIAPSSLEKKIMTIDVDYVEVGREAHQLASTYGRDAWFYANRWEKMAAGEGKLEEAAFWGAVATSLKPR